MLAWLTPAAHDLTDLTCRTVRIPNAPDWLALVSGAFSMLAIETNYEQRDGVTPEVVAAFFREELINYLDSTGACMIGQIVSFATATLPPGYLACDGGVYNRVDWPRLYAVLDSAYILTADTFTTPDLRGKTVIGQGGGYSMAQTGGAATHTLTVSEMPAHAHTTQPHTHGYIGVATLDLLGEFPGAGMAPSANVTAASGVTVDSAGGGAAHENMPPYHALRYAIRGV